MLRRGAASKDWALAAPVVRGKEVDTPAEKMRISKEAIDASMRRISENIHAKHPGPI